MNVHEVSTLVFQAADMRTWRPEKLREMKAYVQRRRPKTPAEKTERTRVLAYLNACIADKAP
jgi:hypothetical protein